MLTGDLVRCNHTGSIGVITKIYDNAEKTGSPWTQLNSCKVLFTDGTFQTLSSIDFKPMSDRGDCYIEGIVIEKTASSFKVAVQSRVFDGDKVEVECLSAAMGRGNRAGRGPVMITRLTQI